MTTEINSFPIAANLVASMILARLKVIAKAPCTPDVIENGVYACVHLAKVSDAWENDLFLFGGIDCHEIWIPEPLSRIFQPRELTIGGDTHKRADYRDHSIQMIGEPESGSAFDKYVKTHTELQMLTDIRSLIENLPYCAVYKKKSPNEFTHDLYTLRSPLDFSLVENTERYMYKGDLHVDYPTGYMGGMPIPVIVPFWHEDMYHFSGIECFKAFTTNELECVKSTKGSGHYDETNGKSSAK